MLEEVVDAALTSSWSTLLSEFGLHAIMGTAIVNNNTDITKANNIRTLAFKRWALTYWHLLT